MLTQAITLQKARFSMTHQPQEERLMKITDVADYFKVTTQTIRNWIKEKTFPNGEVFSPKVRRWKRSEIDDFLNKQAS